MAKDYLDEYEKHRQEQTKEARERLKEVCSVLEPLGITMIEVEYDGCGDSGAVEQITFYRKDKEYKGDLPEEKFESLFGGRGQGSSKVDLQEILDEVTCCLLPAGWEINDGSFGTLKINVNEKSVNLEHNSRYTEVDTTEEEIKL